MFIPGVLVSHLQLCPSKHPDFAEETSEDTRSAMGNFLLDYITVGFIDV